MKTRTTYEPRRRPLIFAAAFAVAWTCFVATSAFAQGLPGHIAWIYPAGGQQGKTVSVLVGGNNLDASDGVNLSGKGVTGRVVKVDKDKTVTLAVSIAADAEPGMRDLRLTASNGTTNRARFVVGQLPEVTEVEPNSDRAAAQKLPALPVVVNGQIMGADRDLFRFSARRGQTIVCRVEAQRLLPFLADGVPGWFQSVVTLYDANGATVQRVDDFRFHPDPMLVFKPDRDGDYWIEIRDALYRGREDFVYRLSLGELPFLSSVFPLGGRRGATAHLELFGANLPHKTMRVGIPSDAPSMLQVKTAAGGVASNELPLAVGDWPEVLEKEPNDSTAQAQTIEPPTAVNGRIQRPGDVDCYRLDVKAGSQLILEILARRLDSPLDSVVTLLDANGRQVAQNDDYEDESMPQITHQADSRLSWTFKKSGVFFLRVADIQGKGGRDYAYRLHVAPPRPDFQLRVMPDNPSVGQGSTVVLSVVALRRDGFAGPIDLSIEGLPKGFSVPAATIPEGTKETMLSMTAPENAPLTVLKPTILGTAQIDGKRVTRQALPAEDVMQAFIYHHLLTTQELSLTLTKAAPFRVIPMTPPEGYIRFGAGRTAFLTVKVERKESAKGAIRLMLSNPPKSVRMRPVVIPADQNEGQLEIKIPNKLPGDVRYYLVVAGTMRIDREPKMAMAPAVLALGPSAKAPPKPKPPTKNTTDAKGKS
ncbi:MAG: PPC domain-containing protein [Thermoguttaceae bacterium]